MTRSTEPVLNPTATMREYRLEKISDLESASAGGSIGEAEKLSAIEGIIKGVQGGQTLGLLLCMTILPCALMLISYFLYKKKYKLDEEEYERICKEIAVKKEGASA